MLVFLILLVCQDMQEHEDGGYSLLAVNDVIQFFVVFILSDNHGAYKMPVTLFVVYRFF